MKNLTSDKLFQILHRVKQYPELLVGKKSLVALENYARGYVDACREQDKDCFTVHWYNAFCDHIAQACGIKDKYFCVRSAIESMGYDDSDGASFFMELFEEFSRKYDDYAKAQESLAELKKGEIRVFRLDKICAKDFCTNYVQDHCKELFGISSDTEQYTWVFNWNSDHSLTCALCEDRRNVVILSQDNTKVANIIKELPIFSVGEKISYTTIDTLG